MIFGVKSFYSVQAYKPALFLLVIFGLYSCGESPSGPNNDHYGLEGNVINTAGEPLDSVRIYCLYNYFSPPTSPYGKKALQILNTADTTKFNLFQNIPNPFNQSTYIRFSLPSYSNVSISLVDKLTGETKYTYEKSMQQGQYQIYLDHIVQKENLKSGIYTYSLKAVNESGQTRAASKEMMVIGDSGAANSLTSQSGEYFFGFNEAFAGDTIVTTTNGDYFYKTTLGNIVNLELKRRGYKSKVVTVELYPEVLIRRDVVMEKESAE